MELVQRNRKNVLLAMDEEKSRELVKSLLLHNYGDDITVVEARDGLDATSKIHFQSFSCIILDEAIPKKNCEAVLISIRNCHMNGHAPVILLTDDSKKEANKKYPFVYFMDKPIRPNELIELTSQQLKLGKGEQRLCATLLNVVC